MSKYHPEPYWSEVASKIGKRNEQNIMAGDDSPYYRYKRKAFLRLFHQLDFNDKQVMELGGGPGGNIAEIIKSHSPKSVTDADISQEMLDLASKNVGDKGLIFQKIDGSTLPFNDKHFDLVFSATVLQHNTNDEMMRSILSEMCRVSSDQVVLFERIENSIQGNDLCLGRPVKYYEEICKQQGFKLKKTDFINIQVSYLLCGAARKLLNAPTRKEGDPLSSISIAAQGFFLLFSPFLDRIFKVDRDLGMLVFERDNS